MKQIIQTKTNKTIQFPMRMFKPQELEEMQIEFVENQILFNRANQNKPFPQIKSSIKEKMCILNYPDCSTTPFSQKILEEILIKQLEKDGDIIILPVFKDESEHNVATKLIYSKKLKQKYNKEIIFEISYKQNDLTMRRILTSANDFDHLAIFYGVHFGRYPSFEKIIQKIVTFKKNTGKNVFCTAVPLIFSTDMKANESIFLPIWNLICDGWVKNWKRGGTAKEIRLIDYIDHKNKNLEGWLKNHTYEEIVKYVNISVWELFKGKNTKHERETYKQIIIDEMLNESTSLKPNTIEPYLLTKCPMIYNHLIVITYIEKMIIHYIKNIELIEKYSHEDILRLANYLRGNLSINTTYENISQIRNLMKLDENITIKNIIKIIDTTTQHN